MDLMMLPAEVLLSLLVNTGKVLDEYQLLHDLVQVLDDNFQLETPPILLIWSIQLMDTSSCQVRPQAGSPVLC